MNQQKRKIVLNCECGKYEILKPKHGNGWNNVGVKKTIHGLDEFLMREGNNFEIEMSLEIEFRINEYREYREKKNNLYLPKTI